MSDKQRMARDFIAYAHAQGQRVVYVGADGSLRAIIEPPTGLCKRCGKPWDDHLNEACPK